MKRSTFRNVITIGLVTASAFTLASCGEEEVNSRTFPTLEACLAAVKLDATKMTVDDCNKSYSEAIKTYKETSPRYADQKLCEEEHGANYCVKEARTDGQTSFMPMFTGYMMGRMMADNDRTRYVYSSAPMYHTKSGYFSTYNGNVSVRSLGTTTVTYKSSYSKPASTIRLPPMTRTTIVSRSGFNAAGRVSFSG